ncbi:MAG TPA: MBL fold metallo-hydrolase [Flavobacteriales bacterium]|nr:MBL fold metallo-hydrolase [Flavobacteriales bacterium]
MKLTFLGTGTSQGVPVIGCHCEVCRGSDPRDRRTRTSALVSVAGANILIDAGPDLRQQMLREGVEDLEAVLLTHEHMDHIAGMDDLRAFSFLHEPPRDMPVYGDARTLEAVKRVYAYAFSGSKYPGIPQYELHTIADDPFKVGDVLVHPVIVMHHELPVTAYRIGGLGYITDGKEIPMEEKLKLQGLDVLVVNALRKKEHPSHFNLDEALALIRELAPQRAYLTHISHLMGPHGRLELPPGVELAFDGLQVEL